MATDLKSPPRVDDESNASTQRILSIAAVVLAATAFGLSYGLSAPLIALNLANLGYGEWFIGLNAAAHAVGVLVVAPFLPAIASRFGSRAAIMVALAMSAIGLAAFPFSPVWLWFLLRFVLGVCAETLFVLTEAWASDLTANRVRARIMALYTAAQSVGFAIGPIVLSSVGTTSIGYWIGAVVAALAIVPLLNPRVMKPESIDSNSSNPWEAFRVAPAAMATAFLSAAIETAGLSFIALYATGFGWAENDALQLVSILLFGAIALQLPIGWLADKIERRQFVLALTILSAAGALIWPWTLGSHLLAHILIFLWGGVFVGIYTVMLAIIGARFKGAKLVSIYAAMSIAWGGGALMGPLFVGFAMHLSPHSGLPYAVAAMCALFAVFLGVTRGET